jgi:hypothetical protein
MRNAAIVKQQKVKNPGVKSRRNAILQTSENNKFVEFEAKARLQTNQNKTKSSDNLKRRLDKMILLNSS